MKSLHEIFVLSVHTWKPLCAFCQEWPQDSPPNSRWGTSIQIQTVIQSICICVNVCESRNTIPFHILIVMFLPLPQVICHAPQSQLNYFYMCVLLCIIRRCFSSVLRVFNCLSLIRTDLEWEKTTCYSHRYWDKSISHLALLGHLESGWKVEERAQSSTYYSISYRYHACSVLENLQIYHFEIYMPPDSSL